MKDINIKLPFEVHKQISSNCLRFALLVSDNLALDQTSTGSVRLMRLVFRIDRFADLPLKYDKK